MASYQEIETRLNALEDMVKWFLSSFSVNKSYPSPFDPSQVLVETTNMLKVYQELKNGSLVKENEENGPRLVSE